MWQGVYIFEEMDDNKNLGYLKKDLMTVSDSFPGQLKEKCILNIYIRSLSK